MKRTGYRNEDASRGVERISLARRGSPRHVASGLDLQRTGCPKMPVARLFSLAWKSKRLRGVVLRVQSYFPTVVCIGISIPISTEFICCFTGCLFQACTQGLDWGRLLSERLRSSSCFQLILISPSVFPVRLSFDRGNIFWTKILYKWMGAKGPSFLEVDVWRSESIKVDAWRPESINVDAWRPESNKVDVWRLES